MTQPSFIKDGNFDWESLPQGYVPTEEDVQYYKTKIAHFESTRDETIKLLADKVGGDPETFRQLIKDTNESCDWFIAPYKKQLAMLEDALVIYRISRSE